MEGEIDRQTEKERDTHIQKQGGREERKRWKRE